ncbi:alkaline phosphatase D family protein [Haliangium ochraceum]|uniref:Alkaline phosphatase n=1 Tax=Haliangium ochraceum (strain DSM 14365 / JCM 11303 / SMP-2) TaxID=502025 RepID=D0LTA9_HALO1|nr:alkaline phosphatase D family protein [Haliangium ochraceum]ACY13804.1 Alkaline phosphatase [Haliangium ochraceum DSM 14365]
MKRRNFLKTSGYFVVAASLGTLGGAGCGDNLQVPRDGENPLDAGTVNANRFAFPQGVASGDPRETSVVLWTRVVSLEEDTGPVDVHVHMSESADFTALIVDETVTVAADSDHTLRMVVTGLSPAKRYFYRFVAGEDHSDVGRTLTAPPADDTAPVRMAWVSCQDFTAGFFGSYREIIKADEARAESEQLQFVVHLGDFIYETRADDFQTALDEQFQSIELRDADGELRTVEQFPSGSAGAGREFARTLDDYRHLYKTVLSDSNLRAARARWPFIVTWDDHEFTNDAWQTQANYDDSTVGEPSQKRKVAANQAWFEYIPTQLDGALGVEGVTQHAADFTPTNVDDVAYSEVDSDNQVTEPNSMMAVESMTIYRSFRYGRHVELVMTDERSYRSDHPLPEQVTEGSPLFFAARNLLPVDMVDVLDQGMTANGGEPPATIPNLPEVANPRLSSPVGTILGPKQKAWWKATMQGSDATWKVWGNEVPLMRLVANNGTAGFLAVDRYLTADAWDGYGSERKELMAFLRDNQIDNVVVITGDIHAHFGGLVMDDYDAETPTAVAAEFCTAGAASNSLFSTTEAGSRGQPAPVRALITYDATNFGGATAFAENLNTYLLHGMDSALSAASSHDPAAILAAKDASVNPHLRYVDTNAQGFGLLTITGEQVTAELITIERPIADSGASGPGIQRTASFVITKDQLGDLAEPEIEGIPPFPLDL